MNFDFGEVLTRAWQIIWKHKILWIFGILASCARGGGNNSSSSRNSTQSGDPFTSDSPLFLNDIMRDMINFFEKAGKWFVENTWVIFVFIGFILLLWVLQIFFANIGQIGLIRGAYHAEMDVEQIRFGDLFGESLRYFWRVIGTSLIIWLPVVVAFIGMFVVFIFSFAAQSRGEGQNQFTAASGLFFLAFCCCLIPVMAMIGLYYSQVIRALLLENLGIFASLSRGWQVFSKNILGLILMGIVLIIFNLVISVIVSIPALIAIAPLVFKFMEGSVDTWQPVILTIVFLCLYSPISLVFQGVAMTYMQTVWTLIYIRVTAIQKQDEPLVLEANA